MGQTDGRSTTLSARYKCTWPLGGKPNKRARRWCFAIFTLLFLATLTFDLQTWNLLLFNAMFLLNTTLKFLWFYHISRRSGARTDGQTDGVLHMMRPQRGVASCWFTETSC